MRTLNQANRALASAVAVWSLMLLWRCCPLEAEEVGGPSGAAAEARGERSPIGVAVSPDGRYCVSANHTSGSVTLVDLRSGAIVAEHRCGAGPVDVVWADRDTILVSLLHDDAIARLKFAAGKLFTEAVIAVGDEPRGIAVLPKASGKIAGEGGGDRASSDRMFVAVSGRGEIAVVNLATHKVERRIDVGSEPQSLAVAPNRRWLVVSCNYPGQLLVYDTANYKLISRREVFEEVFNVGVSAILPDSSMCIVPHVVNRTLPVSAENIEKGWVVDNRLSRFPLPDGDHWDQKQLGLDTRGDAVGDVHAVAISPDADWMVITCGGTHELLVLRQADIPWPPADPGDFIPQELLSKKGLFRRVELGGRPLGVKFIGPGKVVVANYLLNTLQIVDVVRAKLVRTISLGGPESPSLARRGEAIFYDADRSLNSWFSCNTCHTDGHTTGQNFDTLNDRSYNTYKLTPSLRGVAHTRPWTWHGWQTDLKAAMRKSIKTTLSGEKPLTEDEAGAMVAFLSTLEHPASPHRQADGRLTVAARRGKRLFENDAGCVTCHEGPYATSNATYKVGLESKHYFYPEFNPPSLRGVFSRRRFLHDGRAESLNEVLRDHHRPEQLDGRRLSEAELADLIAYLKSL